MRRVRKALCVFVLIAVAIPAAVAFADDLPDVWAPAVPVSGVTATKAKLYAIVDPEASSGTVRFEIGRTKSYGFTTSEQRIPFDFPVMVWATVKGLTPATTYHFRAVATNTDGTKAGPDRTFTTPAGTGTEPPEVLAEEHSDSPTAGGAPAATAGGVPPRDAAVAPTPNADPSRASGTKRVLVPERSKTVVAEERSGAIRVRTPGDSDFRSISQAGALPVGSIIDARDGVIEISADTGGGIDSGRFWGAVFQVRQSRATGGATELALLGGRPARCDSRGVRGRAAGSRKGDGSLWGKDKGGRFRTRGRNSVAAVRGTVWYVAERCAGTLTRVIKGSVAVRDVRRGTTVLVKAGHHLMVRDRPGSSARKR